MRFEYSAGAFIYKKEGEKVLILFLVRDNKKFDIPKGHIEEGENAEQAGKREILEEAGLRVDFIAGFSLKRNKNSKKGHTFSCEGRKWEGKDL